MLFVLSESIAEQFIGAEGPDEETTRALRNIALARRDGKHLVSANKLTLDILRKSAHVNEVDRRVFNSLFDGFSQLGGLPKAFSFYVEVVSNEFPSEMRRDGNRTVIVMPARRLSDFESFSKTTLLCENLRDCSFYIWITKAFLVWERLHKVSLNYEPRGGGGSTIGDEYGSIQEFDKFCLCILDSDKKHPTGAIGRTARSVQEKNDPKRLFSHYHILESREAENLIPDRLLSELDDRNCVSGVVFLEKVTQSHVAEARRYIDMKRGLKLREISATGNEEHYSEYWENVVNRIGARSFRRECSSGPMCRDRDDCVCEIMPGLGDSILARVLSLILERNSPHKISECVSGTLREEWEQIGRTVVSWCCGANPIYSI